MPRFAYVNGCYTRHAQAAIHIEDRGLQFADSIYEVFLVIDGKIADFTGHCDRLERSARECHLPPPPSRNVLRVIFERLLRLNHLRDATLYLQYTRGTAPRSFAIPASSSPGLIITTRRFDLAKAARLAEKGIACITHPDLRWQRVDIKTTGLLAQSLAKQAALDAGAYDAILVAKDGFITEGSSSNAWIVTPEGTLVTRPVSTDILKGVTRTALLEICQDQQIAIEERAFTVAEARTAHELFLTGATSMVLPVITLDGHIIGNGHPGSIATRLRQAYLAAIQTLQRDEPTWQYP